MTAVGQEWIEEHVEIPSWSRIGGTEAVESRLVRAVATGATGDGLVVRSPSALPGSELRAGRLTLAILDPAAAIKRAWISAVALASWTWMWVLGTFGLQLPTVDGWNLIDVAFTYMFAYGIERRSRVCAVLMLAEFVIDQVMVRAMDGVGYSALFLSLVIAVILAHGAWATFQIHEWPGEPEPGLCRGPGGQSRGLVLPSLDVGLPGAPPDDYPTEADRRAVR